MKRTVNIFALPDQELDIISAFINNGFEFLFMKDTTIHIRKKLDSTRRHDYLPIDLTHIYVTTKVIEIYFTEKT